MHGSCDYVYRLYVMPILHADWEFANRIGNGWLAWFVLL